MFGGDDKQRGALGVSCCKVVAQLLTAWAGPIVSGYFLVATEAETDDGCPHTLEHLIFLGSEDYPYKGVRRLFERHRHLILLGFG